ncbi:glycosyltransferase [Patescibacteria group bacterium]|nr:glycosyltransferase [Patescibacteria group bacterium]MCL5798139.1 glycosyltransferase [Patescibacteria group bacterium]
MHSDVKDKGQDASFFDFNLADHLFPPRRLVDYARYVSPETLSEIQTEAENLKCKTILRFNSTSFGGGVAELIPSFAALMNDLGIKTHWMTMTSPYGSEKGYNPPPDFFGITAGLHYSLQDSSKMWFVFENGDGKIHPRPVTEKDENLYLEVNSTFGKMLQDYQQNTQNGCIFIADDPQCVAVIDKAKRDGQKWFWRFHPYGDPASPSWKFIEPYILKHDASVCTIPQYFPSDLKTKIRWETNYPFVDPFHKKLQPMSKEEADKILSEFGVDPQRPILVQVSRFDPDKNPLGILEVFKIMRQKYNGLQLIYTGPFANDNPVSSMVLKQMRTKADQMGFAENKDYFFLHTQTAHPRPFHYHELAAVWQATNTYIIQLSNLEGFGMMVAEASWCGKPVVASNIGGIIPQIQHGKTGFLVSPRNYEEAAINVAKLIDDHQMERHMGIAAHNFINDNFLITANILRWLRLMNLL